MSPDRNHFDPGQFDRRHFALALAAGLAACSRPVFGPPHFDPKVLDKGFPALVERARPGMFAAAVMDLTTTATWYGNANQPFPLGGLAVLPIAAALMAQIDAKRVSLGEKITVRDTDLSPPYSVIDDDWRDTPANFAMNISVLDLLTLAVQYGDNTAADVLMARIGGPGQVTAWLRQEGIGAMRVDRYARETLVQVAGIASFRPAWRTAKAFGEALKSVPVNDRQKAMETFLADPRDSTTSQDAMTLLFKLSRGALASKPSSDLLLTLMTPVRNAAGPQNAAPLDAGPLSAVWPPTAAWAHRAADPRSDLGFTPVQNDIGLVTLKGGRRFAVAVLLSGSTASAAQRTKLFSDTATLMLQAMGG
ncbi:MAG TPA: serine hydrolase [Caulobacteraceae bacterium]